MYAKIRTVLQSSERFSPRFSPRFHPKINFSGGEKRRRLPPKTAKGSCSSQHCFSTDWSISQLLGSFPDFTYRRDNEKAALKSKKRSVSALKKCQFSPAGQSLIQPLLEPFEHNLNPIKSLLQPSLGFILARGCRSALRSWTVLALVKGGKLSPKNRTVFYSPKRLHF